MNSSLVLSLLLSLWCSCVLANDQTNAVVYELNDSPDLYAAAANYLINSGNIRKPNLDQARLMGSAFNWKVMQTSLRDYLFPHKDDKNYKYEDYDEEEYEEEDLEREPYERPHYYPAQPYYNNIPCLYPYCMPFAGYRYPAPYSRNVYYTPRKSEKSKSRLRFHYV